MSRRAAMCALAATLAALVGGGCASTLASSALATSALGTSALFSSSRFRAGSGRATLDRPARTLEPGATKADVLAALGAPGDVIPQATGDIFVYQLRQTDLDVLSLNPGGSLGGMAVPLYARVEGMHVDDVLFIRFDQQGVVRDVSSAWRL